MQYTPPRMGHLEIHKNIYIQGVWNRITVAIRTDNPQGLSDRFPSHLSGVLKDRGQKISLQKVMAEF